MADIDLGCKTPLLHFTNDDVKAILKQYDRSVESVKKDVQTMRTWLATQPHLPMQPSDRQIVSFLIRNKFSIEKTKEKLDMNYTIRSLVPNFYKDKFPTNQEIQDSLDKASLLCLPKLSKNQNRVVILYLDANSNKEFTSETFFSTFCMFYEMLNLLDLSSSDEYICDFSGVSLKYLSKIHPMDIKKSTLITEKVYSNRIAGIHILNMSSGVTSFLDLMKKLLKPKLRDRIKLHKDHESLRKSFSKEMLPKDYGGEEKSLAELKEDWKELLKSHDKHFRTIQNVAINEELRPKKLKDDELLGFHGNFRQLQID